MNRLSTFLLSIVLALLAGCTALPSLDAREPSSVLAAHEARQTRLGRATTELARQHPGLSGIHALADAREAFAVRTLLADAAQRTLDLQYYIWRTDMTGLLMMQSLMQAADRGVRVRLLLDDSANVGFDELLAALDAHDNIEVRLFNPLAIRFPRWINYLVDFPRVNRRMHNKSFTADNQVTIIGGRNIGDEYFGATQDILFSDLDALAIGPVVQDVSDDFDRYWNSASAYPVDLLLPAATHEQLQSLARRTDATAAQPQAQGFLQAMQASDLIHELLSGNIHLEWAPTQMLSDDPAKGLGRPDTDRDMADALQRIFGDPDTHLELVSSYFVPAKSGTAHLAGLAQRGITVRVLTNSLAATDVAAVHAGYAKRRKPLLQAGVKLYEMRPRVTGKRPAIADDRRDQGAHRTFRAWRWGLGSGGRGSGPFGSSGSSLHAKTASIDDERVFIGSFNFDPRSARLNTELGFVIDSPELSRQISQAFMERIPQLSYEVHLDADGKLYWTESRDGTIIRYDSEPEASLWRRAWVGFLSLLPIEWML